jgi:hypothetical protein
MYDVCLLAGFEASRSYGERVIAGVFDHAQA